MGALTSIVIKPTREPSAEGYQRVRVDAANLIVDHGIEGDAKASKTAKTRNLNIMSWEMLENLRAEGFDTTPGAMGEQLIVRGVAVDELAAGDRLRIGADAVVEITKPRTGCAKFETVQGKSPAGIQDRMGMMARVVIGGAIREGDPVYVLISESH